MTDPRINKLPVWVQNLISDRNTTIAALTRQLEAVQTALEAGPEDSDVFAETSDVSRPLGKDVAITFGKEGLHCFTAHLRDDGALRVEGSKDLSIEPSAAFEIILRMKD